MSSLKPRVVIAGLTSKGFKESEGDHRYLILYVNGIKQGIFTKVSRSNKREISEDLIHLMAKQVRLTKSQFLDLARCPMSEEEYIRILREKGEVTQ